MSNILIIDDEDKIRTLLTRILSLEGFEVINASDAKKALKKMNDVEIDLVLCDVKLPDANGVELTKTIKEKYPLTEIIVFTAYGTINDGVQAIKNGAFDYLTKGDDHNRILPLVYKAIEKVELKKKVLSLEKKLGNKYSFDSIIGSSKVLREVIELAKKVSPTDAPVLLTGETGTGKEVFAQAIHYAGKRNNENFVAVNCSAFAREILESELFGHRAGAFTGAVKDRKGLFEEADKGTLFLDEIGEMPIDLQAKLLRVLETGEFFIVGDTKPKKVDVRIIAATHRNLRDDVRNGNFREDLFYRISLFEIELPPLRERVSDIDELVKHFAEKFAVKANKKNIIFTEEYIGYLKQYSWKGNIRELKNIVERSIILSESNTISHKTLPNEILKQSNVDDVHNSLFDLASVEKNHIRKILNYTNGNKTETARLLDIALTTLYRKLTEYDIT